MKISEKYQEYLEYLKKKGYAYSSLKNYESMLFGSLSHSVQDREVQTLRLTDVADVIQGGQRHGAHGAVRAVSVFRRFCKYLRDSGVKLDFDWRDIESPKSPFKKPESLDDKELAMIRNHLDTVINSQNMLVRGKALRVRAFMELVYSTGLRTAECSSLDKDKVDWEQGEIECQNCKTHEWQKVYLNENAIYWLKQYLNFRNDNHQPVFITHYGLRAGTCALRRDMYELRLELGLSKHLCATTLRKTMMTDLMRNMGKCNMTLPDVQKLSRHRSVRTTLRNYTAMYDEDRLKSFHQQAVTR